MKTWPLVLIKITEENFPNLKKEVCTKVQNHTEYQMDYIRKEILLGTY